MESPAGKSAEFSISHSGQTLPSLEFAPVAASGRVFDVRCCGGSIVELKDPQEIFSGTHIDGEQFSATTVGSVGHHTAFLRVKGKATEFWLPVDVEVRLPLEVVDIKLSPNAMTVGFAIRNNAGQSENVRGVIKSP